MRTDDALGGPGPRGVKNGRGSPGFKAAARCQPPAGGYARMARRLSTSTVAESSPTTQMACSAVPGRATAQPRDEPRLDPTGARRCWPGRSRFAAPWSGVDRHETAPSQPQRETFEKLEAVAAHQRHPSPNAIPPPQRRRAAGRLVQCRRAPVLPASAKGPSAKQARLRRSIAGTVRSAGAAPRSGPLASVVMIDSLMRVPPPARARQGTAAALLDLQRRQTAPRRWRQQSRLARHCRP